MKRTTAQKSFTTLALFISACLPLAINSLKCVNCRTYEKELVCEEDCEGEFCVFWTYREMSIDHKIQGCISGIDYDNIPMGCRSNQVEATMCLCNSTDHCNHDEVLFSPAAVPSAMIKLPDAKCSSYTEAPYIHKVNRENTCQGNYCYYTQTNTTNFNGDSEVLTSTSCGQMPQFNFDFLIGSLWPGPGFFANGCYMLQAHGKDTMLGCSCSTDNCNSQNPYPITPGNTHCHLAYGATSEDQLNAKEYCRGDYCVLQKTVVPGYGTQWLKGCLSVNETDTVSKMKAGYRNILGVHQWFCQSDFCNFDIQSVSEQKPNAASVNLFPHPRGGSNIILDTDTEEEILELPESKNSGMQVNQLSESHPHTASSTTLVYPELVLLTTIVLSIYLCM